MRVPEKKRSDLSKSDGSSEPKEMAGESNLQPVGGFKRGLAATTCCAACPGRARSSSLRHYGRYLTMLMSEREGQKKARFQQQKHADWSQREFGVGNEARQGKAGAVGESCTSMTMRVE